MVFSRKRLFLIIGIILLLAFFNSILASTYPDGLERVAEDLGFIDYAKDSLSVLSDYELPVGNELLSTGLAGILGVAITYITLTMIAKVVINNKEVNQDEV